MSLNRWMDEDDAVFTNAQWNTTQPQKERTMPAEATQMGVKINILSEAGQRQMPHETIYT